MNMKDFDIQLSGLKNGCHTFEFRLDDGFFSHFEGDEINGGEVVATVRVEKNMSQFSFVADVEGKVVTTCDRCLDPLEVEIGNEEEFAVHIGGETNTDNEDLIELGEDDSVLNVAERLYEMCVVALPIVKVHDEGECNEEMIKVLDAHQPDGNMKNENSSDPRWDALKQISTKK